LGESGIVSSSFGKAPSWHQVKILEKCQNNELPLLDLLAVTGRSDRTKFKKQVLNPLFDSGLLEMTIPDKPSSRSQKYRLTGEGQKALNEAKK